MTVLGNHMPLKKQLVQIKYHWDLEHVKAPSMVEVLAFRGCLVVAAPNHTTVCAGVFICHRTMHIGWLNAEVQ